MGLTKSIEWVLKGKGVNRDFDLGEDHFLQYGNRLIFDKTDEAQKVILKKEQLEANRIKSYKPQRAKENIIYEPDSLDDYIGQIQSKEQIKTAVKIIQTLRPIHILINGWAGCGKTTLAKITAKLLNANFIYRVPEQLDDVDKIIDVINMIQESEQLTVFMLDEIHTINKYPSVVNVLLTVLQDWQYGDVDIRPFVMIGATTNKDRLVKKQSPLMSRFQMQITLDKYDSFDIEKIIRNYKNSIYKHHNILKEDYKVIAENSRGIPREAISLLLKQIVVQDIEKVLNQSGIVKNGLTNIDIKILRILSEFEKPIGAGYLSQMAGIPQSDYEEINERFLIEKGFICRQARGRTLTEKGKVFLNEIGGKTYDNAKR